MHSGGGSGSELPARLLESLTNAVVTGQLQVSFTLGYSGSGFGCHLVALNPEDGIEAWIGINPALRTRGHSAQ
jgi:hypothetical protein